MEIIVLCRDQGYVELMCIHVCHLHFNITKLHVQLTFHFFTYAILRQEGIYTFPVFPWYAIDHMWIIIALNSTNTIYNVETLLN